MPLARFLQGTAFGADEVALISTAFEGALRELDLVSRTDPGADVIAKAIIMFAIRGERDPERLREQGMEAYVRQI